ncbi:MAG: alpha/beta hydrolase [Actinobacteria bacterium]|nr:MAG: alpha/beta hydrolase [Actinomycetota bacterium]
MIEIFTTPDGLTLSYERRGSGPLLVCHPGGPGGSAAEFEDFAGLDDTFELLLLSPRGSHGSDPADDYALASYVADVEALRAHLGAEQLNLLGFSHGGCVAMAYAAAHPDGVRRLLLVDTLAVWGDEAEAEMTRMIESRSGEPWFAEAQRALEEEQAGAFSSVDELIGNLQRQIPLYFHRWEGNEQVGGRLAMDFAHAEPLHHFNTVEFPTFDLRGELRKIKAPTLVVAGDDDFMCGPACADAIVAELPDARLVTIPESGHFVYIEQPEAFRAALTGFLL